MQRIPLKIELLLSDLEIFFNTYQWIHFKSLLLSLLLTPYRATINGMTKVISFGSHRSKHNEFLIDCTKILSLTLRFYAMLIVSLLKKEGELVYFIIDDSSNKKRGKHIKAAFKFFDHLTKTFAFGQQIVCSIIEYRGIIIPYAVEVYVPREQSEINQFRKKTKIAEDMLKSLETHKNQIVFVLCDSYYATSALMNHCRKNHYTFVSMLKDNRVVTIHRKTAKIGKYIKYNFTRHKNKKTIALKKKKYLYYSCKAILKSGGAVKLVLTKDLSHKTVKAIFTTNTALPVYKILNAYQKRWSIEVFFKMSKQYLGLKASQSRSLQATTSSLLLSMLSYNLLTHLFLSETSEKGKNLTKKRIAQFSVLSMRDRLRQIINLDTIDFCIEQSSVNISKNNLLNPNLSLEK
jgi:SRSO17 transposase